MKQYKSVSIHTRSSYWSNQESHDEMVVDAEDLRNEIEEKCNELANEGYEVISIIPVNSGNLTGGNGYLHTESVIITAKKLS